MAAPTNDCNVKKVLANPEPSTHGPKRTSLVTPHMSAFGGKADIAFVGRMSAFAVAIRGRADMPLCAAYVCF